MKWEDIYSVKPAIYMLHEIVPEWKDDRYPDPHQFRSSDFVVKIGRTRRNPLLRAREQHGLKRVLKYWELELSALNQCERELLKIFAETFNRLEHNRDMFYVVSFEKAVALAESIVQKYQQAPNKLSQPTP